MKTYPVTFNQAEDIVEFVKRVNQLDCDVDLKKGRCVVDAKSLMGALMLGSAREVEVQVHTDDCSKIENKLGEFLSVR